LNENTNNDWDPEAAEDILAEIFGAEKLDGVERIRLEENLAKLARAIESAPTTLEEIAAEFGVSPEVVARIKAKARQNHEDKLNS
jgi:DNA-directed RNA polymerase sigma subunit (sigma70/sigma32)